AVFVTRSFIAMTGRASTSYASVASSLRRMRPILLIVLPLYALDQLTKWLIVRNFVEERTGRTVIPGFFELVYFTNTGAAFSVFKNSNGFFIALSLVTLVVLGVLFVRGVFHERWSRTAFALLLAGILGNLTDRCVHG